MRTTIRLDEHLLRDAKALAAESGTTLTAVIEDALRQCLASRKRSQDRSDSFQPTTCDLGTTRPGVDLDNSDQLLEWMESGENPR
jgi:hypothetical protein